MENINSRGLDFSRAKVLVVGDVMLDRYWHGATQRISPEAPVPVVRVNQQETRVGGAGNVALNVVGLGARSSLIGLVGPDPQADELERLLARHGVQCQLQRVPGSNTITKLRVISRHQQMIRLDFEDEFASCQPDLLLPSVRDSVAQVDALVLSDYAKGALKNCPGLIRAARDAGKPVIVDPKGLDFDKYRGATVITPNMAEFEAIVGRCESDADIERRGEALRESLDLGAVLVTRSEKGMTLLARDQRPWHLPTRAQEVFDVTGAGDTVVALLGAALAARMTLQDAVSLSNLAAGVVVAKLGTTTVSLDELMDAIDASQRRGAHEFLAEAELLDQVARARNRGERIVMTNGCFDLLHPGHVDYLQKARRLGDRLVVAVNDDASVRRLKGSRRPINPLQTRALMLASLGCVDWVVSFSEDTPERLYASVLPDVLVKGGDYSADQVAGAKSVLAAGGRVQIIDFLPGHSTTALVARIQGLDG